VGPTETRETQFRDFVAARSAALLRVGYLLCGDLNLAEDLLQTSLTRTYLAWRRLDGIDSLEAYTRRVLFNTATSWWRRRWRGERPTLVLPEQPVSDQTDRLVERDAVWRLLSTLPARQRAVIVLRYYEDLSEADIAAELGLSVGTVKSHASRALATLRARLAADPDPPRHPMTLEIAEEAK
jgi:RNA polymerase sigma-70 factor, ECF subfamily